MTPRRITTMPLDDVPAALDNPRDHEVEEIAKSIERFGFTDAPVLDERTGRLIAGHGRLEALRWLREHDRPVPEGIGKGWKVPVQRGWSSANDGEAEAMLVALNRLTEVARWRTPGLAAMLERVAATPAGLDGVGYGKVDLDALLAELAPPAFPASGPSTYRPKSKPRGNPADATVTLLHGDCIEQMATLPANSVDAIVSDPPYGLEFMGKDWDSFRVDERSARWAGGVAGAGFAEIEGGSVLPTYGKRRTTSMCRTCGKRDAFRNPHECDEAGTADWTRINVDDVPMEMRAFQNWCSTWAAEAMRVLKPGGHLLAFGGTRTYHRMACGVEEAGFEVRDSIHWIYGSGFPKSLDVGKAIDASLGAVRTEKVGEGERWSENRIYGELATSWDVLAPATEQAEQWDGWGTALKPAHEPIIVARKPLEGTVADNVLRHGTGGLNIDATRVGIEGGTTRSGESPRLSPQGDVEEIDAGRWPPNIVLDETAAAELDAQSGETTSVEPGTTRRTALGRMNDDDWQPSPTPRGGYDDEGGASRFFPVFRGEVACALSGMLSGCRITCAPTATSPSATTPATTAPTADGAAPTTPDGWRALLATSAVPLCDSCATAIAASLAPTEPEPETCRRALGLRCIPGCRHSTLTRNLALIAEQLVRSDTTRTTADLWTSLGCVRLAISGCTTSASESTRSGSGLPVLKYEPKASTAERNAGLDHLEARYVDPDRDEGSDGRNSPRAGAGRLEPQRNHHPTVKPIELMRWLVRLVCAPGATVLDPFAGSGTTLVAAVLEGVNAIGCEMTDEYLPIIEGRIAWAKAQPTEDTSGETTQPDA